MKTRVVVLAIGVATVALGCVTKELQSDQFSYVQVARHSVQSRDQASGWNRAITVTPEQVFKN